MDEKRDFLASIRSSLGYSAMNERAREECGWLFEQQDDTEIAERIRYRTHVEKQNLLQVFEENSAQLNTEVHVVSSHGAAAEKIIEVIDTTRPEFSSVKQVIQHDSEEVAQLQLWKKLGEKGIQLHTCFSADKDLRDKTIASYIGITASKWFVADSGTLVELTDGGTPRSTSLVPSIHISVVQLKDIVADLEELYSILRRVDHQKSITLISGPSKTADIEVQLVYGAHGPKELHVIVIDHQMESTSQLKGSGLFTT